MSGIQPMILGAFLFALLFVLVGWMDGKYRPCEKCGSRRTKLKHGASADASEGDKRMHYWINRVCLACEHRQIILPPSMRA